MYEKEKNELTQMCRLLYERNLVTATDGNVSKRLADGNILLTPSGKSKGFLTAEEILALDLYGNVLEGNGKASKEYPMHRAVYEKRPDAMAVIHTHPVFATAFALAGKNIPDNYLIETKMMLGKVALAEYAVPGTMEMVEVTAPYLEAYNVILLRNHGALTIGKNLMDAFHKMEVLEAVAKTVIVSKAVGEPQPIPEERMDR